MKINKKMLKMIPKTDLHVHLDGSLRLDTLIYFARKRMVKLPSYTESGLRELVFKNRYKSLNDYLEGFGYTTAVLQDAEALEQVAYELMEDNINEGVRYFEVRFAPQLHINRNLTWEEVLLSVNKGLKKARDKYNRKESIKKGLEPRYEYGIIVSALRFFEGGFSEYYQHFVDAHQYTPRKEMYSMASLELARASVKLRNEHGIPIVGFDLAGRELGYPAIDHKEAYQYVHKHFVKKTVHAGEAYGPESIFQAITELHADRIGHGYYLFNKDMISNPNIANHEQYVFDLAQYIADGRITIEVCLTSNLQTNTNITHIKEHELKNMLANKLSVTICTDNRLISNTTVSNELSLAVENFDISKHTLKNIVIYGFKRSFFPATYKVKREYVRTIIDYYEKIEKQFADDMNKPE